MNGKPPFRADHVGSLLRPQELIAARHQLRNGEISQSELREIEDRAIRDIVKFQEDIGLQAVTDGEFRRGAFFSHFVKSVAGMTVKITPFTFSNDAGDSVQAYGPYAAGKLKRSKGITTDEFEFVRELTDRTVKVTMPAPPYVNFLGGRERVDQTAYPDITEYFADLAAVYREELAELHTLGCTFVQLDEVPLAMMEDPRVNDQIRSLGEDPDRLIDVYIDTIASAVRGKPPGMVIGMHLCRGNYRGRWLASGGYHRVAERIFNIPGIDVFFHGVRFAAGRRFFAIALPAVGQVGHPGPCQQQNSRAGGQAGAVEADRRSRPVHRARPAWHQPAMRVRDQSDRQPAHAKPTKKRSYSWSSRSLGKCGSTDNGARAQQPHA